MTFEPENTRAPTSGNDAKTLTIVIYALSLAGFVTGGLTSLVAMIIGLVKISDVRGTVYESHFEFANLTNIWGLVAGIILVVVGFLLMIVLIGFLILPLGGLALAAWYAARLIIGLMKALEEKPIENPRTWLV